MHPAIRKIICISSIFATVLSSGCSLSERQDKKVAERYITSHYGNNYVITGYKAKHNSDSGLIPAKINVSQNDIEYTLDIQDGTVTGDNYSNKFAGQLSLNHILDKMNSSGTLPDLTERDVVITGDFFTTQDYQGLSVDLDYSGARDFNDITKAVAETGNVYTVYFYIRIDGFKNMESEEWIYDFYLACQDELDTYMITIIGSGNGEIVFNKSFVQTVPPKKENITREEWDKLMAG